MDLLTKQHVDFTMYVECTKGVRLNYMELTDLCREGKD